MKRTFLYLSIWVATFHVIAQTPAIIEWQKTIGGSSSDFLYITLQTPDGGYILGGYSSSGISGDKTEARVGASGTYDYWIVKTNSLGVIEWQNTIGGTNNEYLKAIALTSDGGYILGGYSDSGLNGDKTEASMGLTDYWVVKLSSTGTIEWQNTIGGSSSESLYSIQQTSDGGYILGGQSWSGISGDKTEPAYGYAEYWVVKISSTGAIEWQNTIGGNDTDDCRSVLQTSDGGYLVGGYTYTGINGDKTIASRGFKDYWILKLNSTGVIEWQKVYGGSNHDELYCMDLTSDGGFILGGYSNSGISGDKTDPSNGGSDYWVIKTDALGNIVWQNSIGGISLEYIYSIVEMPDQGFILGGYSNSNMSGDKSEVSQGLNDYWIVKMNSAGVVEWENTIGGAGDDLLYTVYPTADGGFITGGYSGSGISGDKTNASKGLEDYWLIKLYFACTPEVCDGIDNDCDGYVDEDLPLNTYYQDNDYDGYGNPDISVSICGAMPPGFSMDTLDCIDYMSYVNPDAQEVCNFMDDDCDGLEDALDPSCTLYDWYADNDHDGDGAGPIAAEGCYPAVGYSLNNDDCDDTNADVYWGATEVCNGIDDNCDYFIDWGLIFYNYYIDADGDGYGSSSTAPVSSCEPIEGYAITNTDCDDNDLNINPSAYELCNGVDDDCDAAIDNAVVYTTYFFDADSDGFGDTDNSVSSCNGAPAGYVSSGGDCDDAQLLYNDIDGDGYGSGLPVMCGVLYNNDCEDENASVFPGQFELCNSLDDNCDGLTDNDIVFTTYYIDQDGDGYGTTIDSLTACTGVPVGYAPNSLDCDDSNSEVNPGMNYEIANGLDDDCDGLIDNDAITVCPDMIYPIEWQNTIGGNGMESNGFSEQTSDGGYILAVSSSSNASGDKTENSKGSNDIWLLKLDNAGAIEWQKTIGGSGYDVVMSVHQTTDGGYIVLSESNSPVSGDKTEGVIGGGADPDYWVLKFSSTGAIEWQNTIGGSDADNPEDLILTSDGGYIMIGSSVSDISGDKTEDRISPNPIDEDIWIVKINSVGNIEWENTIGGLSSDFGHAIVLSGDGGYFVAADSYSDVSVDKTQPVYGQTDYWVLKLSSTGDIIWQTTVGGSDYEWITSIAATADGGCIVNGYSYSGLSGNKTAPNQSGVIASYDDYFVVKFVPGGAIEWQRTFGGDYAEWGSSVITDSEGFFYITGSSMSGISGNKTELSMGNTDIWIIKTDASGNEIWQNVIGGASSDDASSVTFTNDGGLLVSGDSFSPATGDKTEDNVGAYDAWIFKLILPVPQEYFLDADNDHYGLAGSTLLSCQMPNGYATNNIDCNDADFYIHPGQPVELENGIDDNCDGVIDNSLACIDEQFVPGWQLTLGGSVFDFINDMKFTPDGGMIVGGVSYSGISGNKITPNYGDDDYWLVKLNASHEVEWQKSFGGDTSDNLGMIAIAADGGYLLAGHSWSGISVFKSEDVIGDEPYLYPDFWIVKTDANGNLEWENTIGGDQPDYLEAMKPTPDGGYILGGHSWSGISGDKTENTVGEYDLWIVKIDAAGNILWQQTIGGSASDYLYDIEVASDGGFLLSCNSSSGISGDKTQANFGAYNDWWIIRTDQFGNIIWQQTIGGDQNDGAYEATQSPDGGWLVTGHSVSGLSGNKTEASNGGADYWIVKLDDAGNILWQNAIGGNSDDVIYSAAYLSDGGAIINGYSRSGISGDKTEPFYGVNPYDYDSWVLKIDGMGNIIWQKSLGGIFSDYGWNILVNDYDGIIVGGNSSSPVSYGKTSPQYGSYDIWIFTLDPPLAPVYYPDADGDGFGADADETQFCEPVAGYILVGGDCDDTNAAIHNGTTEICNGLDDDCNGMIDDGTPATTYYADADGDSYGDISNPITACDTPPSGYVLDNSDCDDTNAAINVAATEICNGLDDDCNGVIDNGATETTYYADSDGDGFGDISNTITTCDTPPSGYVLDDSDCNDANANIYPFATEICNTLDDDCDILIDEDLISAVITPDGPTTFCKGNYVVLNANTGAGYTYIWYKNNSPIPGATASSYTASKSGSYTVKVTISGGCFSISDAVYVSANPKPSAIITVLSDLDLCTAPYVGEARLKANPGTGFTYQWYKNNVAQAGATSQTYSATTVGNYKVKVTNTYGCSKTSTPVAVTTTCRESENEMVNHTLFEIYPNPNSGTFELSFISSGISVESVAEMRIINTLGELVIEEQLTGIELKDHTIQLNNFGSGIYFVQLVVDGSIYSKQVVIQQ